MREILFRGKRKDNGEWVYGWLIIGYDHRYYIVSYTDVNCLRGRNKPYATWRSIEVIPATVGQYTGLTANGKKIFEGDILYDDYNEDNCLIVFQEGGFDIVEDNICWHCQDCNMSDFEVIGTIHDNPELLKGGVENDLE